MKKLYTIIALMFIITISEAQVLTAHAGNNQTICQGNSATIGGSPTATGGTPGYSYSWSPIGDLNFSTIANPIASPTFTTTYTLTVTDTLGATDTSQVTIAVSGYITVSAAGPDQSLCGTVSTLGGNMPLIGTGVWTLISGTGNITTPSDPNSVVTGLLSTTNVFLWTITNPPCTPSIDTVILTNLCSGVDEINNTININIYPNPFNLQTTISFAEEQHSTTILITDVVGKEIKALNFTGRQLVIDRAEMKAGIYFVQTTDKQKRISNKKIIIQ